MRMSLSTAHWRACTECNRNADKPISQNTQSRRKSASMLRTGCQSHGAGQVPARDIRTLLPLAPISSSASTEGRYVSSFRNGSKGAPNFSATAFALGVGSRP